MMRPYTVLAFRRKRRTDRTLRDRLPPQRNDCFLHNFYGTSALVSTASSGTQNQGLTRKPAVLARLIN